MSSAERSSRLIFSDEELRNGHDFGTASGRQDSCAEARGEVQSVFSQALRQCIDRLIQAGLTVGSAGSRSGTNETGGARRVEVQRAPSGKAEVLVEASFILSTDPQKELELRLVAVHVATGSTVAITSSHDPEVGARIGRVHNSRQALSLGSSDLAPVPIGRIVAGTVDVLIQKMVREINGR